MLLGRYWGTLTRLFALLCIVSGIAVSASTQSCFETAATNSSFYQPPYPLVFIASFRDNVFHYGNENGGATGMDVLEAGAPERGQELWILLPNGAAKKLFPYATHQSLVDHPIGPTGGRINGTVTEPSISIDGKRVYFSYFHDCIELDSNDSLDHANPSFSGWAKGADIYSIDLSPIIADQNFDPSLLPITRLTQTSNKFALAMNESAAQSSPAQQHGNTYIGALEMDSSSGRKLVFASDLRRLRNSNSEMSPKNRNFNIFTADLNFGNPTPLSNLKQFQYYTTTSALSPARLRDGIAYSYQATTEDARNWQIQGSNSEGKWFPVYGYATLNELAHLGSLCIKTTADNDPSPNHGIPRGEYFAVTQYYNGNNNGYGHIRLQDTSKFGVNKTVYDGNTGGFAPKQVGSYLLTDGITFGDEDSPNGKFTAPECGKPDEIYLTYSPYPANHRDNDYAYPSWIVQTDLDPHNIGANPSAYKTVVKSTCANWAAIWPKPVMDWSARLTGVPDPNSHAHQEYTTAVLDPATVIPGGMPYALVGTSALFNTDITAPECKIGSVLDPATCNGNCNDRIVNNVDSLTNVQNNTPGNPNNNLGWCEQPLPQNVFGIAIYLTGNKIKGSDENGSAYSSYGGYVTDGGTSHPKETKRLLGVYSVVNQADTSFKALIPANMPVDFQLIHRSYGLKWTDVRSWHSFKPRETRNDCGGCHNHRENEGLPWDGTYSALPSTEPLDMATKTQYIDYDVSCHPVLRLSNQPVRNVPVWQEISAEFDQYCGGCHRNDSSDTAAQQAFTYTPAELNATNGVVSRMAYRSYLSSNLGALSSPAFWAAYGARTDGRNNSYAPYQPNLALCATGNPAQCGYIYSSVHDNIGPRGAGLCDGDPANQVVAQWVYKFGLWIDNHMPVNTQIPGTWDYQRDRFHPTVDAAFTGSNCAMPSSLVLGYWDDSGTIASLAIDPDRLMDPLTNLANGSQTITLGSGSTLSADPNTIIKVTAIDPSGNRQSYSKTVRELINDCIVSNGGTPPDPNADDDDDNDTPGDDPDDSTPPDGADEIGLSLTPATVKAGKAITLSINARTLAGARSVKRPFIWSVGMEHRSNATQSIFEICSPASLATTFFRKSKVLLWRS